MRNITRLRNLSLSSIGSTFRQPDFWTVPQLLGSRIGDREKIDHDFEGYIEGAYKSNGIIFTCILIRQYTLSEARFQFQRLVQGRPGELWGDPRLSLLENPFPNGTTGELISRMEQDASLAGNFYGAVTADGTRIRRLRPDWVTIITGAPDRPDGSPGQPWDLGASVVGYLYQKPGDADGAALLTPDQVVHWSPNPDPSAQWKGMSWVTAIVDEIKGDKASTKHKLKFFENGATSNHFITYAPEVPYEQVAKFAELFGDEHAGVDKAYRTVHLGGGADVKMAGADMKQLDFKVTQGAGESRMAAASLVGAVVAQFSEGMQGSSLNAGNFTSAMRRWSDIGARPLWRSMAAALSKPSVVEVPSGSRLWYDDRDIPFLQDDAKDAAEILQVKASAVRTLSDSGFDPDTAVEAITSGDLKLLRHTGLPSVQVQPPNDDTTSNLVTVPLSDPGTLTAYLEAGWRLHPPED